MACTFLHASLYIRARSAMFADFFVHSGAGFSFSKKKIYIIILVIIYYYIIKIFLFTHAEST